MAATFPGGVKVFTTKQAGDQIASAHINDIQAEVVAIETELKKTTGSVVDHGGLAGLADNDHPQYLLATGKAADSDKLDGIDSTGFATSTHNHDTAYLGITAKAADSDKLDGKDSTDFVDKTTFDSGWTSYTPTFDGWTGTVNNVCKYKTIGKTCIVRINITAGTSDSTDGDISTATLPFKSRNVAYLTWDGACGKCADNGTILTTPCRWEVLPDSDIVSFYKDMNVGAWTKSGTKYQKAIIIYEIA